MTGDSLVVLARRGEVSYLLINHLAKRFPVSHVVFEAPRMLPLVRWRLRKLGAGVVLGQLALVAWDRAAVQRTSRPEIERLLTGHDVMPPDDRIPVTDVASVNGPETAEVLRHHRPRVVVVSGTGIIRRHVLELAPVFLNIHCGMTPRYRGVHGAFWAVMEGRPDLAGTTVHVVDPGVDTGEIVGQATIEVDPWRDTYRSLVVKQYLAGLDLMTDAVRDALAGDITLRRRDDLESRQWFSPTLGEYVAFNRRLRSLRAQALQREAEPLQADGDGPVTARGVRP